MGGKEPIREMGWLAADLSVQGNVLSIRERDVRGSVGQWMRWCSGTWDTWVLFPTWLLLYGLPSSCLLSLPPCVSPVLSLQGQRLSFTVVVLCLAQRAPISAKDPRC